jgi:hypothetical protein
MEVKEARERKSRLIVIGESWRGEEKRESLKLIENCKG